MNELRDLDGFNACRGSVDSVGEPLLTIFAPSAISDGGQFFPPESVSVRGVDAMSTLLILIQDMVAEATRRTAKAFPPLTPPISGIDPELGVRL